MHWMMVGFFGWFVLYDAANTEIYTYWHTLSLHDALPISELPCADQAAGAVAEDEVDGRDVGGPQQLVLVDQGCTMFGGAFRRQVLAPGEDRKSTRLNSSP